MTMFRGPAVSMSMAVLLLVRCGDGAPAGSLGPASYRPVDQVFAAPESFNRTRRDDDDGDGVCDCSGAGCCYCSCSNGCCSDYCNDCEAICDSCPTAPPTPSPTTDRCTADEYDVDGSCYPVTECVVGTTFETNPPTATSNRVCATLKPAASASLSRPSCQPRLPTGSVAAMLPPRARRACGPRRPP